MMRLKGLYPGVKLQDVIVNTGFKLIIPKEVEEIPPPTEEDIDILRNRIDIDKMLRQ